MRIASPPRTQSHHQSITVSWPIPLDAIMLSLSPLVRNAETYWHSLICTLFLSPTPLHPPTPLHFLHPYTSYTRCSCDKCARVGEQVRAASRVEERVCRLRGVTCLCVQPIRHRHDPR